MGVEWWRVREKKKRIWARRSRKVMAKREMSAVAILFRPPSMSLRELRLEKRDFVRGKWKMVI